MGAGVTGASRPLRAPEARGSAARLTRACRR
jgi:hypothetical protein